MTALVCDPWLITPPMHKTLTEIVMAHTEGGDKTMRQHAAAAGMMTVMIPDLLAPNPEMDDRCARIVSDLHAAADLIRLSLGRA
jgi:hypothetical protein